MRIEIIAEAAQGFEGNLANALFLVRAAASAKSNAIKFQCVYADELATNDYEHYQLFSGLEMDRSEWGEVKGLCDDLNLELILDVFGAASLGLASDLGLSSIKLHATDIENEGFLRQISNSSIKRVIIGVGGTRLPIIKKAVSLLGEKTLVICHGFQGYPTAIEDNHLSRLKCFEIAFSDRPNVSFGISDHADPDCSTCMTIPALAIGLGAQTIEKHLTPASCMRFEDYEAALSPDQFANFVNDIRKVELAYGPKVGEGEYKLPESENIYRSKIQRHVIAIHDLKKGQAIEMNDVCLKRSGVQDAITDLKMLYGRTLAVDVAKNTPLEFGHLK